MQQKQILSPNAISFIGLCNEYCIAIERVGTYDPTEFTTEMLRLLPRIYISASDLNIDPDSCDDNTFINEAMDETHYTAVRQQIATLFGADDTFLEVFEEDMKYSDTPIAASISESLADIMQVMYNFISTVREAPTEVIPSLLAAIKEDFTAYWSRIVCNVLRPLNQLRYNHD